MNLPSFDEFILVFFVEKIYNFDRRLQAYLWFLDFFKSRVEGNALSFQVPLLWNYLIV